MTNKPNLENIEEMFEMYKKVFLFEVGCGVYFQELRHLIGRLGELYVANSKGGEMALKVNQEGFDVVLKGERISVKTTTSTCGKRPFSFNKNTLSEVDRIVLLRINEKAEIEELFDDTKIKAIELMNKAKGNKVEIRQSKLNNLNQYFPDDKKYRYSCHGYDKETLEKMKQIEFTINEQHYSLYTRENEVRLINENMCVKDVNVQLRGICRNLGIPFGKNTESKTLANRIIEKYDMGMIGE